MRQRSSDKLCTGLWRTRALAFGTLMLAVVFASKSMAQSYTYAYDELGRLIAVVDPSGNAGVYKYDKVGNLLSISNTTSATVSIFTFTPSNGPAGGLSITIYGDGFSATPGNDTVTFYNNQVTTPTSANLTTLVVPVPAGATTGPIKVTVAGVSATSSESFQVK